VIEGFPETRRERLGVVEPLAAVVSPKAGCGCGSG
jgi:hypothetical protein